ncbi:hypothetical protein [Streptomyces ipomoeae]|uniref:hypothetical protein n=1 Tax=Streptomyces ipomoeae TaxID=103232 RepID=UPI0029BB86F8|nr:hypothetical protein [Streptomyces ipomoeae]MDX2697588.1 hypothetical protein [Streptomyces ipomoeae]MDX2845984.1 hypothetical protein [Streptomyces ipomoeae]
MQSTDQPQGQPTPRATAVQAAADACDTHQAAPDTQTLRAMTSAVQAAQNLGATLTDIRDARTAVNA